ncbi:MAG TPA: hypothetical protein VF060_12785 [Trebonia sp.]
MTNDNPQQPYQPYGPPQQGGQPPHNPYQQQPPRKKRHRVRNTFLGIGGGVVAIIAIAAIAGSGSHGSTSGRTSAVSTADPALAQASAAAANDASPTPSPSPSVVPPNKIEFVISGYAPADPACGGGCDPDITYGSDSDTHDVTRTIDGTVTYSVPFNGNALYYSLSVSTDTSDSHLTCKIVAVGPSPDAPLTVSSASETGQNICSAQAAPADSSGLSWTNEQ